jgi:hypothetical protein
LSPCRSGYARAALPISGAATQDGRASRPTGLGHGVYKDSIDYGVFSGEWCIGRIYENRSGPEDQRWFWALHAPSRPETLRNSNQVATLEAAKAEFEASWKQWKAWAKMEEVA